MIKNIRKSIRKIEDTNYNKSLIKKLQKDHQKLLKFFSDIEDEINKKSPASIKKLEKFLDELELHLTLENSKLYANIETKYKFCNLEKMHEIKEEIPKNSNLFEQLKENLVNEDFSAAQIILSKIKNFLLNRIEFEENKLYKVYEETYKCEELNKIL